MATKNNVSAWRKAWSWGEVSAQEIAMCNFTVSSLDVVPFGNTSALAHVLLSHKNKSILPVSTVASFSFDVTASLHYSSFLLISASTKTFKWVSWSKMLQTSKKIIILRCKQNDPRSVRRWEGSFPVPPLYIPKAPSTSFVVDELRWIPAQMLTCNYFLHPPSRIIKI